MKRILLPLAALLLAALFLAGTFGCAADEYFTLDVIYDTVPDDTSDDIYHENYDTPYDEDTPPPAETPPALDPDGAYTSKEDVALYIYLYGTLPPNFITKAEARELGWSGGGLEQYAPGMCIGGDHFGNFEGLLPDKSGREYTECDINTLGADSRGPERIVFSNDGLIYYTPDHYESFELMYGEE